MRAADLAMLLGIWPAFNAATTQPTWTPEVMVRLPSGLKATPSTSRNGCFMGMPRDLPLVVSCLYPAQSSLTRPRPAVAETNLPVAREGTHHANQKSKKAGAPQEPTPKASAC